MRTNGPLSFKELRAAQLKILGEPVNLSSEWMLCGYFVENAVGGTSFYYQNQINEHMAVDRAGFREELLSRYHCTAPLNWNAAQKKGCRYFFLVVS